MLQLADHMAAEAGMSNTLYPSAITWRTIYACQTGGCQKCLGCCFQVLYTQGDLQLWKATYKAGKVFNARNAASQDLNPSNRTVVNKAEYYGNALFVTASGTYEPLVSTDCFCASISSKGAMHVACQYTWIHGVYMESLSTTGIGGKTDTAVQHCCIACVISISLAGLLAPRVLTVFACFAHQVQLQLLCNC
eukprot:GHRR01003862.1.p1 GENE.GHRR01003862.1~~GHRR01003862.1.p1  ORF type:complete len:192 (-),score=37.74 GHRR01003862.1:1268-1843(-)